MRTAPRWISRKDEGRPNVDGLTERNRVVRISGMVCAGRHYADNFERQRLEHYLAADDVRIGCELVSPNAVAQDDDAATIRDLVTLPKLASACRLQTQDVEKT